MVALLDSTFSKMSTLTVLNQRVCRLSSRCGQGERPAVPELCSVQRGAHSPRFGQSGPEAAQRRQLQETQHQEDRLIGQKTPAPPRPPPHPPLRLHSPPLSLPGLTLHSTFYSFYFLLRLHGHCSGRSDFVFCIEEEYFRIFVLLETFIQIFHLKGITQRWRRSFSSGVCVLSTPSESPAATVVTHVKLLKEADGDTIWTSRSCSLDISQMGRNHREKFCSLIHSNTSLSLRSDFTLQCEPDGPNDSSRGGGRATCSDI